MQTILQCLACYYARDIACAATRIQVTMEGDMKAIPRVLFHVLAFLLGLASGALAQPAVNYPNKPIRIIIPYASGGPNDIIARHVAGKLTEIWGQQIVVDSRTGASGNISLEAAARATPDGYTLYVGNVSTNAINETTFSQSLRIKPSRDLVGVTNLIETAHILAVNPGVPANDVKQFVEFAKRPGTRINYGSAGIGAYSHLDMVVLAKAAGFDATHIPYKGGAGQMVPAIIGGEVQAMFVNLASTLEHVHIGRVKALATAASTRLPELPNVPTMAESGYPGIGTNAWIGMFAPAAVPTPILNRLHATVVGILQRQEMKDTLARHLMTVGTSKSPEEFTAFVRAETEKWAGVVRDNNIKVE
jgi:tripartite-type tricarboxylate transporter receptor subunit TctC